MAILLTAITTAILLLILPPQHAWAGIEEPDQHNNLNISDLPTALAEDDSFDDLPFEQLRQALREEVERGPKRGPSPRSNKRYNLLIR